MRTIFVVVMLIFFAGCVSSQPSSVRIIIAGNIQGKIMKWEERSSGTIGTLARAGGLVERRLSEVNMPTVLLMTGNTIQMDNESKKLRAELITKAAKMIGYEANLVGPLELLDSPEAAKERDVMGWKMVLSNVKPKENVEAPVKFESYQKSEPVSGWYVYTLNFLDKPAFGTYELMKNNYEYVEPSDFLKSFIRTIRPKDMVIIYYQTALMQEIVDLYKVQEAQRIDLIILDRSLYLKINERAKRHDSIKDINLVTVPITVSDIQEAILTWNIVDEKWQLEHHQLQVGLNYPEQEEIAQLLKENEAKVRELGKKDSYTDRIKTFLPSKGKDRLLLESDVCAKCHESEFEVWENSKHSQITGKVTCDVCHNAGDPHIRFEEWYATVPTDQHVEILNLYSNRLIDFKPDTKKCSECHTGEFNFDEAWAKIEHMSSVEKSNVVENEQNETT